MSSKHPRLHVVFLTSVLVAGLAHAQTPSGTSTPPRFGSSVMPPEFPSEYKRRGLEGSVIAEIAVSADGRGRLVGIVSAPGGDPEGLWAAAIAEAVANSSFIPATRNGVPVDGATRFKFTFRLSDYETPGARVIRQPPSSSPPAYPGSSTQGGAAPHYPHSAGATQDESSPQLELKQQEAPRLTGPTGVYGAYRCIRIEHVDSVGGLTRRLRNNCAFDVEAFWKDPRGGWSQGPIPAGGERMAYSGAVLAMACHKGHFLDKRTEACKP